MGGAFSNVAPEGVPLPGSGNGAKVSGVGLGLPTGNAVLDAGTGNDEDFLGSEVKFSVDGADRHEALPVKVEDLGSVVSEEGTPSLSPGWFLFVRGFRRRNCPVAVGEVSALASW